MENNILKTIETILKEEEVIKLKENHRLRERFREMKDYEIEIYSEGYADALVYLNEMFRLERRRFLIQYGNRKV